MTRIGNSAHHFTGTKENSYKKRSERLTEERPDFCRVRTSETEKCRAQTCRKNGSAWFLHPVLLTLLRPKIRAKERMVLLLLGRLLTTLKLPSWSCQVTAVRGQHYGTGNYGIGNLVAWLTVGKTQRLPSWALQKRGTTRTTFNGHRSPIMSLTGLLSARAYQYDPFRWTHSVDHRAPKGNIRHR